jgi:hypothetical protein
MVFGGGPRRGLAASPSPARSIRFTTSLKETPSSCARRLRRPARSSSIVNVVRMIDILAAMDCDVKTSACGASYAQARECGIWYRSAKGDITQIFPWRDTPGYNLTTGMADDAIAYMRQLNGAAPDKPFFVYFVPGGTHAPHQPTPEWIEKFKGKFDMGWNKLREEIFANQKRLGVIPPNTQLTPWPDDLPKCRARDSGGGGHGQARQHAHHLHLHQRR